MWGDFTGDGVVYPAFFHEGHEEGAGFFMGGEAEGGGGLGIGVGLDGGGGGEDQDSGQGTLDCGQCGRGFDDGVDDADDGDRDGGGDLREGEGGGGVAGDDEDIGLLGGEELGGLYGVAGDGGLGFGAVGEAGGIAEVEIAGAGEQGEEGAQDGESAEARIEDGDGGGRHRLEGVAFGGEDVDGLGGVGEGVGAGEVGVAVEGVAGVAVDEETSLLEIREVGVEGGEDGAEGEVFDLDAGGGGSRRRPW